MSVMFTAVQVSDAAASAGSEGGCSFPHSVGQQPVRDADTRHRLRKPRVRFWLFIPRVEPSAGTATAA